MKFRAYPGTKESTIPWIGLIPNHWDLMPMHALASLCNRSNKGMNENNLLSLSYGRIKRKDIDAVDGLLPASFETYQIVEMDDIVFRMTDLQNDKRSLRSAIVRERGIITSAYTAVKPRRTHPGYFAWLMRTYDNWKVFYGMGGGLRQSLKFDELKRLPILAPSPDEQKTIATFLDHETAKIDHLIEKQQRLIALLKEKRQAVISHAVTKGLAPTVPMKDSGVEWLGEVPKNWNTTQIRYIISQTGGGTPSKDREDYWGGDIPWVSPKDMKRPYIGESIDQITPLAVEESSAKIIPEGSILIVVRGMILTHSVPVALTTRLVTVNQDMKALVPGKRLHGEFFLLLLMGMRDQFLDLVEDSAHGTKRLSTEKFERLSVALPPVDEQVKLVKKIHRSLQKFDLLMDKARHAVKLLQERRTALISAAVTGKIDVRNHPSAQPDDTEAA